MDAYTPCPCGSGKKIKFCCGADVIPEVDKIDRMLDGEQRRAALEHIARLPAKLREKPSIWAKKIQALLATGDADAYDAAAREMLAAYPDNPVALACVASTEVQAGRVREGVAMLQRAIESIHEEAPGFGIVLITGGVLHTANALLAAGHVWAARAHLRIVELWMEAEDNPAAQALMSMDRDATLPLVWKDDSGHLHCAADAPYKAEFDAAAQLSELGKYQTALTRYEALLAKYPKDAALWRAVAIERSCLADDTGAAEAYQKAAALDNVPLDEAVEYELYALALRLSADDLTKDGLDLLSATVAVHDLDALLPRLLSDKRLVHLRADLSSLAEEDRPPPRDAFRLLDRPALDTAAVEADGGASVRREDVPCVLAELFLFGRETDRDARIEMEVRRDELDKVLAILAEIALGAIGEKTDERVLQQVGQTQRTLVWRWHWPLAVATEAYERLSREEFCHRLLEFWPHTSVRGGSGKTYAEAARDGDPHLRRLVLAAILDLESNHRETADVSLFNQLRTKLGLPTLSDIDPFRVDLDHIALLRLSRLPAQLMPDEQLLMAFNLAASVRAAAAMSRLGEAIVERSSVDVDRKVMVLLSLARATSSITQLFDYLRRGRELDVARGKSPAIWLLEELAATLSRPDKARPIDGLIEQIMAHRQEQGVAQQLIRILTAFGVIDPRMMYNMPSRDAGISVGGVELKAQTSAFSGEAVGVGAPVEEKKSGLWLPGMD